MATRKSPRRVHRPRCYPTRTAAKSFTSHGRPLNALKAEAAPGNATNPSPSDPGYTSTNDALSALLWRTVMAVQNPVESLGAAADPVSAFALAIDGRSRTNPPVHQHIELP